MFSQIQLFDGYVYWQNSITILKYILFIKVKMEKLYENTKGFFFLNSKHLTIMQSVVHNWTFSNI